MSTINRLLRNSLQSSRTICTTSTCRIQPCPHPLTRTALNSFITTANPTNTVNNNIPTQGSSIRNISSNRSKRGLYDGKDIRSGNNVSFSMKKTKRKFKPNVFRKRLYSEMLDEMIQFHVTTSALRTIDEYGGLDNYLLRSRHVVDGQGEGGMVKQRLLSHINYCQRHGLDVLPKVTLKSATGPGSSAGIEKTSEEGVESS